MSDYSNKRIYSKQEAIVRNSRIIAILLYIIELAFIALAILFATTSMGLLIGILELDSNTAVQSRIVKIIIPFRHFHTYLGSRIGETGFYIVYYMFAAAFSLIISFQTSYLHKVVKSWADGNSPFNQEQIRGIRILSVIFAVAMFVFQPLYLLFGTIIFIFTFLMEYGSVLEEEAVDLIHSHEQIVLSLANAIEGRTGETGAHVKRVSEYSKVLAEGLGLNQLVVNDIKMASMLHDIGKLFVSDEIISKSEELTEEDIEELKAHTKYGYDMLSKTNGSMLEKAKLIASEHHEKWDGTGYEGKSGVKISTVARIVAIADMYDEISSKNNNVDSKSPEKIKLEIESYSGTYFDPELVEIFSKNYDKILEIRNKYLD